MLIVDRFEGNKAVVFDGEERFIIDRKNLSDSVCEGDVIFKNHNGIYVTDKTATLSKREENIALLKRIINKENG